MSTNPTRGENNDPPAWLESPKTSRPVDDDEETKSSGTRKAIKVKKSRRSSVGLRDHHMGDTIVKTKMKK